MIDVTARAYGRVVRVRGTTVTIRLTWWAALTHLRKGADGRRPPLSVTFPAAGCTYRQRQPGRWWPGQLTIDAPTAPNPWGGDRRHRLRYGHRQGHPFNAVALTLAWATAGHTATDPDGPAGSSHTEPTRLGRATDRARAAFGTRTVTLTPPPGWVPRHQTREYDR